MGRIRQGMTERMLDLGRPAVVWSGDPAVLLGLRDEWAGRARDIFWQGLVALYDRPGGTVQADCTPLGVDRLKALAARPGLHVEGVCRENTPVPPTRPTDYTWLLAASMDAPLVRIKASRRNALSIGKDAVYRLIDPYIPLFRWTPGTRPMCRFAPESVTVDCQPMEVESLAVLERALTWDFTSHGWTVHTLKRRPYYTLA